MAVGEGKWRYELALLQLGSALNLLQAVEDDSIIETEEHNRRENH